MTIDEAINTLEYIKNNPTNDVDAQLLPEAIELFDTAIDIMRKYQKICKILDKSDNGEQCMYDTIEEIEEVRDGNDG